MSCYQCHQPFDADRALPKLLPRCGHTLCALCLQTLLQGPGASFKCPFDAIMYSKTQEFPDNLQFLELAKQKSPGPGLCRKHDKKLELFCHNCQETVCSDCALFAGHKFHEVEQLADTRLKMENKIRIFRQKVAEARRAVDCRAVDLTMSIESIKKEKLDQIEEGFAEILETLIQSRDRLKASVTQYYDRLGSSLGVIRSKLEDVEMKVNSSIIETELSISPAKEKLYEKEIEDIEQTVNSRLMLTAKQQKELVNVNFERKVLRAARSFCKLVYDGGVLDSAKKRRENDDVFKGEENLLHESFRDAIQQASDSLFREKGVTVEESLRFRDRLQNSPTPHNYISELKGYSPMSGLSNKSGISNISKGDRSMLKKGVEKPQGSTLMNNGTQKKSLNNYETETNHGKRSVVASPHLAKKPSQPDHMSVRSNNTNTMTLQSNYNVREKENMTGSQVNTFYMSATGLTQEQVLEVLKSQMRTKGDTIDLSNLGLTDDAMCSLEKSLTELKDFKVLKLSGNKMTDRGLKSVLKAICKLNFQSIFLVDNLLGSATMSYLVSLRKYSPSLKAVYLAGNTGVAASFGENKQKIASLQSAGVSLFL